MKKYYLFENDKTLGPYSLNELKAKNITPFTAIWCEGFESWKTANELEELKSIFITMPTPNLENNNENLKTNYGVFENNKKVIYIILFGFVLVLFTLGLMNYQSKKIIEIEKTNKEIQKENYLKKIESQKEKLEEQSEILTKKGQAEKDRFDESRIQADEDTYKEILSALSNSYKALDDAKEELEKAKGYRIFRSAKKKEEQINDAAYEIEIWQRKIELLKLEKREVKNRLNQSK
jgi:hypothetical protein